MSIKVAALLWLMALPGVIATAWLALPLLVGTAPLPMPLATLQIATAIQSAVLVLAAAFAGAMLAPRVGLTAPVVSALAYNGRGLAALRPQLLPGAAGGCMGAAVIVGFYAFAPEPLQAIQADTTLPLVVRVLYGGVTEEVLIRWGLMTALAWAAWKITCRGRDSAPPAIMWLAIVASALIFGLSHVPALTASLAVVSAQVLTYVTLGNALFGVVAGYLFWRHGLEAAILAHVLAHLLAAVWG